MSTFSVNVHTVMHTQWLQHLHRSLCGSVWTVAPPRRPWPPMSLVDEAARKGKTNHQSPKTLTPQCFCTQVSKEHQSTMSFSKHTASSCWNSCTLQLSKASTKFAVLVRLPSEELAQPGSESTFRKRYSLMRRFMGVAV